MNFKNVVKIAKQIIALEDNHEKEKDFIKDFIDSIYFKEFPKVFKLRNERNVDLETFYKHLYGLDKNKINKDNFILKLSEWLKKKQMYFEVEKQWIERYIEHKNNKVPSNERIKINLMKSDFAG